jgi:hypothetical protein
MEQIPCQADAEHAPSEGEGRGGTLGEAEAGDQDRGLPPSAFGLGTPLWRRVGTYEVRR